MKETTRYRYEQRIEELKIENTELLDDLYHYKGAVMSIYDTICKLVSEDKKINQGWILEQIRRCLK